MRKLTTLTPSVRFSASIISSPPFALPDTLAGEYDCFHRFSPGNVSTELLDVLLLLAFLFGVINRLDNSMNTSNAVRTVNGAIQHTSTSLHDQPQSPVIWLFDKTNLVIHSMKPLFSLSV